MHIPHGDPLLVHMMMLHELVVMWIYSTTKKVGQIQVFVLICSQDISDARMWLKDLEEFIMSPKYLEVEDEDAVMLIQLVFVLKGLHGRDVKTCIPAAIYKLADNRDDWNRYYI
uniref:Uncharacterized protein n=1 Tax=Lactuca sativa TaxID=4236 RepID=A0A9R1WNC9_LACSA|nr:hypothetical protein LSAT_V11C900496810 [Lactuca sativa]